MIPRSSPPDTNCERTGARHLSLRASRASRLGTSGLFAPEQLIAMDNYFSQRDSRLLQFVKLTIETFVLRFGWTMLFLHRNENSRFVGQVRRWIRGTFKVPSAPEDEPQGRLFVPSVNGK